MRELRIAGHYLSFPLLVLSAIDVLAVGAVFYVAATLGATPESRVQLAVLALVAAVTAFFTKAAVGLYHIQLRVGSAGIFTRTLVAFVLGLPIVALAVAVLGVDAGRATRAVTAGAIAYGLLALMHAVFFALADAGALQRRILVLGAGDAAAGLTRMRRRADRRGFDVVGFVPLEEVSPAAAPLARPDRPLCRYARDHHVDEVVVALEERRNVLPIGELVECRFHGISVVDLATFIEREAGKVRLDLLRPGWLVFEGNHVGTMEEWGKRLVDVVAAGLLVLITLPFSIGTIIAIKREDGWRAPVLYRQTRVGSNGTHFDLLKFRSMRLDAEGDGQARWAARNDDRVTRVGQFIRKARIDELPQLINVLRGHMSLVGPRPERPEFVSELEESIPFYAERHRIKPGVTGWAQLLYPYGASHDDAVEKLQFDLYYLKNRSLLLDVIILLQTVEVVLFGKGAR